MSPEPKTEPARLDGLLVVDKGQGLTSHDVVGMLRRVLGTREVGHTGTLDPIATGALVMLVGEATKLAAYLTTTDKIYETTLRLGASTDSLDADGVQGETAPVPALDLETVRRATVPFLGETDQQVPAISAVKVGGKALHKTARKGREVAAPVRRVTAHSIDVLALREAEIDLRIHCGKGFYVRSLGRDLAQALGTVGHLTVLRRIKNGPFDVTQAVPFELILQARREQALRPQVREALLPLRDACALLPQIQLSEQGVTRARFGQLIETADVISRAEGKVPAQICAAFDALGTPVALVQENEAGVRVIRGFRAS
jgi:tRNA pseudouridine55 synthase